MQTGLSEQITLPDKGLSEEPKSLGLVLDRS